MVKLYSRPHRYPVSLSKIPKLFILPILQSLLTYNWELTSTNSFIIGLTLKEEYSLVRSPRSQHCRRSLEGPVSSFVFTVIFSPHSPNVLMHLTLEICFFYSLTFSNSHFQFLVPVTLRTSHLLFQGLKQIYNDVWSFSMTMQLLTAYVGHQRRYSHFTGNIWTINHICWNNSWETVDFEKWGILCVFMWIFATARTRLLPLEYFQKFCQGGTNFNQYCQSIS